MQVLCVSVGEPRDVVVDGRTVRTSIFKSRSAADSPRAASA